MSSVVERRQHLRLVLEHLQAAHRQWVESDRQHLREDDPFAEAVQEVLDVFANGDLPAGFQPLFRTVDQLRAQWASYLEHLEGNRSPYVVPGNGFWKTLEHLFSQFRQVTRPQRKSLEPIKKLLEDKVSERQICLIYGWVDAEGNPEFWKLREEIEKPGTHVNEHFVPPHERQQRQKEAEQEASFRRLMDRQERKVKLISEPGPEPIEDLIRAGVSAEQIAKIKRCSVDDVYARCEELGLPRPIERYEPPGRGPHDPDLSPEQEAYLKGGHATGRTDMDMSQLGDDDDDDDELPPVDEYEDASPAAGEGGDGAPHLEGAMTLEQEIVHWHHQGLSASEISKAVSTTDRKVSTQRVSAVLQRYEKDPDAFRS